MWEPLLAALLTSLASLVGILLLKAERRVIFLLVSFAAGVFLGGFFLHVLPKVFTLGDVGFLTVLLSFVAFGIIEKFLHFHSHDTKRSIGWINLLGDLFHNFLDGLGIAAAFKVNQSFGWLFTFMVIAHEVPQELGDVAVLLYSGMKKKRAILLNLLVSLSSILGVITGWIVSVNPLLLVSIVGGSFLYIAASDLIPLLREEADVRELPSLLTVFFFGIILMYVIKFVKV